MTRKKTEQDIIWNDFALFVLKVFFCKTIEITPKRSYTKPCDEIIIKVDILI